MDFIYRFIYGGIHTALVVKNQPKSKNVKYHYVFILFFVVFFLLSKTMSMASVVERIQIFLYRSEFSFRYVMV